MHGVMVAGIVGAVLAGSLIGTPASAAGNDGLTVLTFTRKTWNTVNAEMVVRPGGRTLLINTRSFGFPARALDRDTIAGRGTLALVRADASLTIGKPALDLSEDVMSATLKGLGPDYDLFDLANVKRRKGMVKATVHLATGQAATLNQALKTTIFTDGMPIGTVTFTR